jgi:V8-like Glu-specific endopeptidase
MPSASQPRTGKAFTRLGFATIITAAAVGCGATDSGESNKTVGAPIVNGTPFDTTHNSLVSINGGGCSAIMLNPSWVLTAQHCVQNAGQPPPASNAVFVQHAGTPGGLTSDAIYQFGEHDIALAHLSSPLSIDGSTSWRTRSARCPRRASPG